MEEKYFRFFERDGKMIFAESDQATGKGIRSYSGFIRDLRQTRIDSTDVGQEVMAPNYELIADVEQVMVDAVIKLSFGEALKELMSKRFLKRTYGSLSLDTGLDGHTISKMRENKSMTRENIVRACLGLHLPPAVSFLLLIKAEKAIDPVISTTEEKIYLNLLTTQWYHDYEDVLRGLEAQGLGSLLKN